MTGKTDSAAMAHLTASRAWQRAARLSIRIDARVMAGDTIADDDPLLISAIASWQRAFDASDAAQHACNDKRAQWAALAAFEAPGSESGRHMGIATQAAMLAASEHIRVATGAETMHQDA